MKLLIVTQKQGYEVEKYQSIATELGFDAEIFFLDQTEIVLSENQALNNLLDKFQQADLVVMKASEDPHEFPVQLRSLILQTNPELASKIINGQSYVRYPFYTKFIQLMVFQQNGLPFSKSTLASSYPNTTLPVVSKGMYGNNGQTVKLVSSQDELDEMQPFEQFIQEPLPLGSDYRVMVVHGVCLGAIKRSATTGFLNNVEAGGTVEKVSDELMPILAETAIQAAKSFQCDFAGVDIMFDSENRPCLLELNRMAGFAAFEQVYGDVVARAIFEPFRAD